MTNPAFKDIEDAIKEIAIDIDPDVQFIAKYGGEVFAPDPDDPKKIVGGVFAYKDHVSVEFSNGADFDDPNGHLEGGGKARRHLKLRALADVNIKNARFYLNQALSS